MVNTQWIGSPNYRSQNGIPKRFIVDHWMVGTLAGTDALFQRESNDVATQFGVGQSAVHQYVNEKDYAFGWGTTEANRYGISIEHEGGWLLSDGTRSKPSDAVHELSAQLHADISRRWNMGKLIVGVNVFPHSHFVATACPGLSDPHGRGLDLHRIVARANQLLFPAPKPHPARRYPEGTHMYVTGTTHTKIVYALYTDDASKPRLRLCGEAEAAYALGYGLALKGDDPTLTMLGNECGYKYLVPNPVVPATPADVAAAIAASKPTS